MMWHYAGVTSVWYCGVWYCGAWSPPPLYWLTGHHPTCDGQRALLSSTGLQWAGLGCRAGWLGLLECETGGGPDRAGTGWWQRGQPWHHQHHCLPPPPSLLDIPRAKYQTNKKGKTFPSNHYYAKPSPYLPFSSKYVSENMHRWWLGWLPALNISKPHQDPNTGEDWTSARPCDWDWTSSRHFGR